MAKYKTHRDVPVSRSDGLQTHFGVSSLSTLSPLEKQCIEENIRSKDDNSQIVKYTTLEYMNVFVRSSIYTCP